MHKNKNVIYQILSLLLPLIFIGLLWFDISFGCTNGEYHWCYSEKISQNVDNITSVLFYVFFILNFVVYFLFAVKSNSENITLLITNSIIAFCAYLITLNALFGGIISVFIIVIIAIPFLIAYFIQVISLYKTLKNN